MPIMVEEKVFDSARDAALIKAGTHFYCYGHLSARPIEEQSSDPRYCRSCCECLLQEAESLNTRAAWVPKPAKGKKRKKVTIDKSQDASSEDHTPSVKGDTIPRHIPTPPANHQPIMSTVTAPPKQRGVLSIPITLLPPVLADIIAPGEAVKKRRGPKQKDLPVELIKRWAEKDGMGSKMIATRLGKERDIEVSYKTIQRILAGKRFKEVTSG